MNIAMLSYHTCPLATLGGKDTGGMNVYVRELATQLGRMKIHVDVFTRSQDEHVPHVLHDLGFGNRVVHVPAGPEYPLPKSDLSQYLPTYAESIRRFAEEKNIHYDVIHSHYWMSGIAALELQQAWNAPIVQMFHTLGHMKNRVALTPAEMEGPYRVEGEQTVIRGAQRIIAATLAEKAQLEFLYQADKRKITIIPPGVDTSRFYPIPCEEARDVIGIPCGDNMILYVGRIEPLKGIDTLIQALAAMRSDPRLIPIPHYLTIIGGDPDVTPQNMSAEMARLRAMCKDLGLNDMVLFIGKRSQDTLPYYYSAAEIVVVPSHYESFGMVALEAMACGTPVVASQVGGLGFLVQNGVTGYSIPDRDPNALAERLTQLICDPELRAQLGAQAKDYAQAYAWENIASRMIQVYEQLLQPKPAPQP